MLDSDITKIEKIINIQVLCDIENAPLAASDSLQISTLFSCYYIACPLNIRTDFA